MNFTPRFLIFSFIIFGTLLGCQKKVVNPAQPINNGGGTVNNNGGTTTTGGGTTTGSNGLPTGNPTLDTSCYAPGVGNEPFDYFNLPNIIAHGAGSNQVVWSSATDPRLQAPGDQSIFASDNRFNIRVVVLPSPGQGTATDGTACTKVQMPYTKMQIKVGVKLLNAPTYSSTYVFDDIPVNGCSPKHAFFTPPSSDPYVVEVMDVKWDYTCNALTAQGFPDQPQCPWDFVFEPDCFEIVLQLATDTTKDLPY